VELRKLTLGKPAKLLVLLVASMLIATASAAVYYSMIVQPTMTIGVPPVTFTQGNDWSGILSLGTNSTWAGLALKAYPNVTWTYEQVLNVSNADTVGHDFRLCHTSITPASGSSDVGNFTFINFCVKDANGVVQTTFNYTTSGYTWTVPSTTAYVPLPAETQWIICIETRGAAGATSDISASIGITLDIK